MELKLQKWYKWTLNATLQNTSTGEIEIKLSIAPISSLGFVTIEPWVNLKEETIFYHRVVGNSIFVYWVNRDNPLQHIIGSSIVLANSVDIFNYMLDSEQAPYIFKKSVSDVIIKGGKFYINNTLITINDVDTSVPLEDKVLDPNDTNYVYIKNNDYFISQAYDATLYPVADIVVDAWWNITSITKHKFKDLLNASGYAPLDELWKIPFQYLPAVFAAIEEYATIWEFPVVWELWILYVVIGESLSYRWDWDSYVAMTGIWDMFSGNNLSELTNMQVARDNLNVYSQIESDERYLNTLNNLDDLNDIQIARDNLDVYTKLETKNNTDWFRKLVTYWETITSWDALVIQGSLVYKSNASNYTLLNFIWFALESWILNNQKYIQIWWLFPYVSHITISNSSISHYTWTSVVDDRDWKTLWQTFTTPNIIWKVRVINFNTRVQSTINWISQINYKLWNSPSKTLLIESWSINPWSLADKEVSFIFSTNLLEPNTSYYIEYWFGWFNWYSFYYNTSWTYTWGSFYNNWVENPASDAMFNMTFEEYLDNPIIWIDYYIWKTPWSISNKPWAMVKIWRSTDMWILIINNINEISIIPSDTIVYSWWYAAFTIKYIMTKRFETTIKVTWNYRIKFTLQAFWQSYYWWVDWQIYKNWAPYWTLRSIRTTYGLTIEYTEDLLFKAWDTCEIWATSFADTTTPTQYAYWLKVCFTVIENKYISTII